jgi:hypothetical protein
MVFGLVCLVHAWRLVEHFDVRIGSQQIPMWPSAVAALVSGVLSFWMWRASTNR